MVCTYVALLLLLTTTCCIQDKVVSGGGTESGKPLTGNSKKRKRHEVLQKPPTWRGEHDIIVRLSIPFDYTTPFVLLKVQK